MEQVNQFRLFLWKNHSNIDNQNQYYELMYSDPKVYATLRLFKRKYRFLKLEIVDVQANRCSLVLELT